MSILFNYTVPHELKEFTMTRDTRLEFESPNTLDDLEEMFVSMANAIGFPYIKGIEFTKWEEGE